MQTYEELISTWQIFVRDLGAFYTNLSISQPSSKAQMHGSETEVT